MPANLELTAGPLVAEDRTAHLRDPSCVLHDPHSGTWHFWATRIGLDKGVSGGWWGAVHHFAAPRPEGPWTDRGPAVCATDDPAAHDNLGTYTPDAIRNPDDGVWYLFYSATARGFRMDLAAGHFDPATLNVARSATPDGPWERSSHNPIVTIGPTPQDWDGLRVDEALPLLIGGRRVLSMKGVGRLSTEPLIIRQQAGRYLPTSGTWFGPYDRDSASPVACGPNGERGFEGYAIVPGPDGLLHLLSHNPLDDALAGRPLRHLVSADGGASWRPCGTVAHPLSRGTKAPHPIWRGVPGDAGEVLGFIDHLTLDDGRLAIRLLRHQWVQGERS
jgi:hypothetical protein